METCLFLHVSVFILINSFPMTSQVFTFIVVCNELIVTLHVVNNTINRRIEFIYGGEQLRYGRSCNLDGEHLGGMSVVTTQTCQERDTGIGFNVP